MRAALVLLAASLLGTAACGGSSSSAVPCDQVIDHLLEISKALYGEGGPAATPDDRTRMIQACEQHDGADQRACELAAKDIDAYFACDEKK